MPNLPFFAFFWKEKSSGPRTDEPGRRSPWFTFPSVARPKTPPTMSRFRHRASVNSAQWLGMLPRGKGGRRVGAIPLSRMARPLPPAQPHTADDHQHASGLPGDPRAGPVRLCGGLACRSEGDRGDRAAHRGAGDRAADAHQQPFRTPSIRQGNEVVLLRDGPATYAAMTAAIGAATRRIDMESYQFDTEAAAEVCAVADPEKRAGRAGPSDL